MTTLSMRLPRAAGRFVPGPMWLVVPAVVLLAIFFVVPSVRLLLLSVTEPGGDGFSTAMYQRMLDSGVYLTVLNTTFRISLLTALMSVALAYPLAYWISQFTGSARRWMVLLVTLPLWTSYLIKAFAWLVLLSRNGVLNGMLVSLGLAEEPKAFLYSEGAVLLGMVHMMVPMVVLVLLPVFDTIDKNLVRAAGTLGAGSAQGFWLVYFPLSLPGVVSGALLAFLSSLGFFIVPVLLGGRHETMAAQLIIEQVQMLLNWPFAGALAAMLLIATLLACWVYDAVFGLSSLTGEAKARRGSATGPVRGVGLFLLSGVARISQLLVQIVGRVPGAKRLLGGTAVVVLAFLLLPTLVLIPLAFTSSNFLQFPLPGFSMKWMQGVWDSPIWWSAGMRSAGVGVVTGLVATVLGTLAAIGLARSNTRWSQPLFALFISPMIVPRIVIAVGLFYQFSRMGIVSSDTALVLGHSVLAFPLAFITVSAVLKQYDWRLNQAAATLGAGRTRTFVHITTPLIWKGLGAAFLLSFITSFDDLTVALFVAGGVNTTLPKKMWDDMLLQATPTLAAVSTLVLLLVVVLLVAGELMGRKQNRKLAEATP